MTYKIETFMETLRKSIPSGPLPQPKTPKTSERPLIVQISEWLAGLPRDQRGVGYQMEFFVARFGKSPGAIGPVLSELGFKRERVYSKHKAHRRYWEPPVN